jgi:hypothetical protein
MGAFSLPSEYSGEKQCYQHIADLWWEFPLCKKARIDSGPSTNRSDFQLLIGHMPLDFGHS